MSIALSLLALALVGTDGTPAPAPVPAPNNTQITYQFRVFEMDGLDWREPVYARLQPVTRQGSATLWTAPSSVVKTLTDRAHKAGRVTLCPKVTAFPQAVAHVSARESIKYVAEVTRRDSGSDGAVNRTAYQPEVDQIRPGFTATLIGRKLDQGILAQVVVEDTQAIAMHTVKLSEPGADRGEMATIQVPEVARCAVAGEWLIPTDHVLLVSLGAHTMTDDTGTSVVRERLAMLEVQPAADPGLTRVKLAPPFVVPRPSPPPDAAAMPVPTAPSRSLPERLAADGSTIPLPPLPEPPTPPTLLPGSSEPCASPQAPARPADKKRDPDSTQASHRDGESKPGVSIDFDIKVPALKPIELPPGKYIVDDVKYFSPGADRPRADAPSDPKKEECNDSPPPPMAASTPSTSSAALAFLSFMRPILVRLPINGNMNIEIRASIAPERGR